MSKFPSCALVAFVFLAAPTISFGQRDPAWDDPVPMTDNAALLYWQAMAVLPRWTDDQRPFIERLPPDEDWLGETAKEVFSATEAAMLLMHRAARLKKCDWGTDLNDGPLAFVPQNAKSRELTRLARFRVQFQSRNGNLDGAINDGLAILCLARNMSSDKVLVATLTGYANEAVAVAALAEVVPQLSPDQLRSLAKRHAALPSWPPIGECLLSEKRTFLGWFAREVKEGRTNSALNVVEMVAGSDNIRATGGFADEKRRAEVPWFRRFQSDVRDKPELFAKVLEQTASLWDEGARLVSVPEDDLNEASAKWSERLIGTHFVSRALLPPLSACHGTTIRVNARHAILQAGIAYCLDGTAALQGHLEPFTRKQFTLEKDAGGFELRSELGILDGEPPLVVRFGPSTGPN